MYPYFYPSYFNRPMTGAYKNPSIVPLATSFPGAAAQAPWQELPPVPGKTAGSPVVSVPPAPVTPVQSPVDLGQYGQPGQSPVDFIQSSQQGQSPVDFIQSAQQGQQVPEFFQTEALPVMDTQYTQGFLKTQIGKKVKVEFLIGTNTTTDRIGTLVGVGISYVLIRLAESDDVLLGDLYSIKFVTFYQ